jgi:hypothetical protein
VPAIEKQYLVTNGLSNSVIISNGSNASPTGITVTIPTGRSVVIFNDATNIAETTNYVSNLSLGTALSPANGGTGLVSPGTSGNVLTSNGTVWLSQAPAASGVTTGKAIAMAMIFGF